MDKSVFQMDPPDVALEHRFKCAHPEKSGIKATFDRIRAQLAQEAEQRSRPVSRIYSGFRAVKAEVVIQSASCISALHKGPIGGPFALDALIFSERTAL